MVVPRLFFDRTARRGTGCYPLSGLPDHGRPKQPVLDNPDPPSAAQPVNPACSLALPRQTRTGPTEVMQFNAPTLLPTHLPGLFRPVSGAPKNPLGILRRIPERAD